MSDKNGPGGRVLVSADGKGWRELSDFQAMAQGQIDSREQFEQVLSSSTALIHVWPTSLTHPVDACGLPVIRAAGRKCDAFISDARSALAGKLVASKPQIPPLSIDPILQVLQANVR